MKQIEAQVFEMNDFISKIGARAGSSEIGIQAITKVYF